MSPYFFDRKNDSDSTERESPDFSDAESNKCDDAIAIIGLSLEFPSANSADNFWDLIVSGRSAARNFPPERVNHAAWHNAEGSRQGMVCCVQHLHRSLLITFDSCNQRKPIS